MLSQRWRLVSWMTRAGGASTFPASGQDLSLIHIYLALVKYKKLVGGGMIKIVNNTVPAALFKLGYNNDQVNAIVSYIDATGTIEGAPGIKPEHLAVFDCSFKPSKGCLLYTSKPINRIDFSLGPQLLQGVILESGIRDHGAA